MVSFRPARLAPIGRKKCANNERQNEYGISYVIKGRFHSNNENGEVVYVHKSDKPVP